MRASFLHFASETYLSVQFSKENSSLPSNNRHRTQASELQNDSLFLSELAFSIPLHTQVPSHMWSPLPLRPAAFDLCASMGCPIHSPRLPSCALRFCLSPTDLGLMLPLPPVPHLTCLVDTSTAAAVSASPCGESAPAPEQSR